MGMLGVFLMEMRKVGFTSVLELAVFIVFFGWVRGVALCPSLPTLSVLPQFLNSLLTPNFIQP